MPGPVTYVTDAISNGRRESLNTYVRELLALPAYISRCELVRELFAPRDGDYELDPDRVAENFRHSSGSQSDVTGELSRTASRQSSQGRINGGGPNGYGSMGPPPQKNTQPNGMGSGHYRIQSDYGYQGQGVKPQSSTLTQASSNSSALNASSTSINNYNNAATNNNANNAVAAIKIKVSFQDETLVIRMSTDLTFGQLREKCKDRLKIAPHEEVMISYRDEPSGSICEMLNDRDLDTAMHRNGRLVLELQLV